MYSNLFLNLYFEKNEDRRKELETCLQNNLKSGFDEIIVFVEEKDLQYFKSLIEFPMSIEVVSRRPVIQKYIDYSNIGIDIKQGERDLIWGKEVSPVEILTVIANSDVFIDKENLDKLKELPWQEKKMFVGLSRWDLLPSGKSILLDRNDTADVFCFFGKCDVDNANCPLGFPGVENSLLHKFHSKGYEIFNPSKSIKTYHLHNTTIYNYREGSKPDGAVIGMQICPEPYYFKAPHFV